jgi:hypothetical protein
VCGLAHSISTLTVYLGIGEAFSFRAKKRGAGCGLGDAKSQNFPIKSRF